MAINSSQEGCDSYSVVVLTEEEGNTSPHCELPVALSSSMEDYMLIKSQLSLDNQLNNQTYVMKMVENTDAYSECNEKDVDIEKGKLKTPRINEESVGNLRIDEGHMKSLQKQISFEMGSKYMQFLMNHSLILPKFPTRDKTGVEKVVEAPRVRKYKRSASFNSRKVVLLFSVLSSLGTIILIYLTLRVKQISDASSHSI